MARPKSDDRRSAIMSAAIRVIATEGLGAATAAIAKEAGVSNGSLFTYFETKADLFNELYIELKAEMSRAALDGLPVKSSIRKQVLHMWTHWLRWAASNPDKRRTLAHLYVADDITPESRQTGHKMMAGIAKLVERSREKGVMRDAPLGFVVSLMSALADTTVDFMIQNPSHANKHADVAFDAMWRMLA